ncbi:MAG: hypothetical protein GY950_30360 [bacterium]|nr:hypothetical protein [bacterium]
MRRFSSYGPVNSKLHYHVPREKLIHRAFSNLMGENHDESGHYITVWAPRQCGKTWVMQEAVEKLKQSGKFDAAIITMERAKEVKEENEVMEIFIEKLQNALEKSFPQIEKIKEIPTLFSKKYFQKPVILILDEFDALEEEFINRFAGIFRDMFVSRTNERNKISRDKAYLLHGLALIGVRSVLGIENETGSPFNVQRSLHIPNLTKAEVESLFQWYTKESGQTVEPEAINNLYDETRGQPGLTCWLGELLTEGFENYTVDKTRSIEMKDFKFVYTAATVALPNNNILNLISKAKKETNKIFLLEMFKTGEKLEFTFDDPTINDLYMNGLVDKELDPDGRYYLRFSCPLVQKRIFNYLANSYFRQMGQLLEPFSDLDNVITDTELYIPNLIQFYQTYLKKNKEWLFKSVPRRVDMRIYEAVYHFNLYSYLDSFLRNQGGRVFPEFPTGNGKIDLIITYEKKRYGIELKSFTNERDYKKALKKAAQYGKKLNLPEIYLVSFNEYIDAESRKKYEKHYLDEDSGVKVIPIFVATGV